MALAHALHIFSTNVRFLTDALLLPEYAAAPPHLAPLT